MVHFLKKKTLICQYTAETIIGKICQIYQARRILSTPSCLCNWINSLYFSVIVNKWWNSSFYSSRASILGANLISTTNQASNSSGC